MMLREYLAYHDWALKRLLHNLDMLDDAAYQKELPLALKSIHKTLVHVAYYTHKPFNRQQDAATLIREEVAQSLLVGSTYLLNMNAAERMQKEAELWQIMLHNIYHYGQINALLALEKIEVDSLDIFVFLDLQKNCKITVDKESLVRHNPHPRMRDPGA